MQTIDVTLCMHWLLGSQHLGERHIHQNEAGWISDFETMTVWIPPSPEHVEAHVECCAAGIEVGVFEAWKVQPFIIGQIRAVACDIEEKERQKPIFRLRWSVSEKSWRFVL